MRIKKLMNEPIKMNLQLFAEEDPSGDGQTDPGEGDDNGASTDKPDEKLELFKSELQKKIEAESDRKLELALKKRQKEWEAETERKIQEALEEKERLASLSEKERKEEELTKKEKELEKRLKEIERKELRADAIADLTEKELPVEFADLLLGEDAESTLENINNFKKAFDEAVNKAVKEKLRQDTPPSGSSSSGKSKVHSFAEMRNKQDKSIENAPNPWANPQ